MIKKILIFSMLALLLGGAVLQNVYLENSIGRILALADETEAHFLQKDKTAARASVARLTKEWERTEPVLASLVDHEEVDDIHIEISGLEQAVNFWYTEDIPVTLARLKYALEHITSTDRISLHNIL